MQSKMIDTWIEILTRKRADGGYAAGGGLRRDAARNLARCALRNEAAMAALKTTIAEDSMLSVRTAAIGELRCVIERGMRSNDPRTRMAAIQKMRAWPQPGNQGVAPDGPGGPR